jgi:hypothetical protein
MIADTRKRLATIQEDLDELKEALDAMKMDPRRFDVSTGIAVVIHELM